MFAPVRCPGDPSLALEIVAEHLDRGANRSSWWRSRVAQTASRWQRAASTSRKPSAGTGRRLPDRGRPTPLRQLRARRRRDPSAAPDLEIEIVPGVSSVTAAAAAAGSLADRRRGPAGHRAGHRAPGRRRARPGRVRLRGHSEGRPRPARAFGAVGSARALSDHAVYVRRCGWPDQQIVRTSARWPPACRATTLPC